VALRTWICSPMVGPASCTARNVGSYANYHNTARTHRSLRVAPQLLIDVVHHASFEPTKPSIICRDQPRHSSFEARGFFLDRLSWAASTMRPAGTFPRQASFQPFGTGKVPWQRMSIGVTP
jgi:hypothetical protein